MAIVYETKWKGMHAWHRPKANAMYLHLHDYVEVLYVRKGTLTVSVNFTEHEMHAGDVIFAFPGQVHGHNAGETENIVLLFPKNIPVYDAVFRDLQPEQPLLVGAVDAELDEWFMQATAHNNGGGPYGKGCTLGYIALILGKLLPQLSLVPAEHTESTVEQRLIEYCSTHYTEPISLSGVAEALGYSATHLSHLFADKFRIGFSKFITAMRIEDAKKLLRGTAPITAIALDCGFGSMRNFNRAFKDEIGMTPSEYRKGKQ